MLSKAAILVLLVMTLLPWSSNASAWTDSRVHGVNAEIDVDENGNADVTLTLRLLVNRGRLRGMEIAGLEDATLQSDSLVFKSDEGIWHRAKIERQPEGKYKIELDRKDALPPAEYRAKLRYTSRLKKHRIDGKHMRMAWTLPGWETGLDDVRIRIRTPKGTKPVRLNGEKGTYTVEHVVEKTNADAKQTLLWRKPHQPRISSWTVAFDVPSATAAVISTSEKQKANSASQPANKTNAPAKLHNEPRGFAWLTTLLIGFLALRRRVELSPHLRPLVHLNFLSAGVLIIACTVASIWLHGDALLWAWVLPAALGVFRTHRTLLPLVRGERKAFIPSELSQKTDLAFSFIDPTLPLGALVLCAVATLGSTLLSTADAAIFAAVVAAMSFTGTRFHKKISALQAWRSLAAYAERPVLPLGKQLLAIRPVFALKLDGDFEVRLSLASKFEQPGLESFELVVHQTPYAGALLPEVRLWITTRTATGADDIVKSALKTPTQTDGKIRGWMLELNEANGIVNALTSTDARQSAPWLLRVAKAHPRKTSRHVA